MRLREGCRYTLKLIAYVRNNKTLIHISLYQGYFVRTMSQVSSLFEHLANVATIE